MFGIGLSEIFLILVVLVIVMGPDRLPELARGAGKIMRELKALGKEFKDTSEDE